MLKYRYGRYNNSVILDIYLLFVFSWLLFFMINYFLLVVVAFISPD